MHMAFFSPSLHPIAYPPSRSQSSSSVPRRSDSLAGKPSIFQLASDDLHDARRVLSHGQEEDLKTALLRVITRVEEMTTMLRAAYAKQTELETNLTLSKSNLQMAQANAELLEDMLRRNQARRSLIESHATSPVDDPRRLSVEGGASSEFSPITPNSAVHHAKKEEGGFFATFGRSRNSSPPALSSVRGFNHNASASMPSLVSEGADVAVKQIEELKHQLEGERTKLKKATDDKAALEEELESLSQALFEEANRMVATERIKAAEIKEELSEAKRQKEALNSALKIIETENSQLRAQSGMFDSTPPTAASVAFPTATPQSGATSTFEERTLSRASSNIALKSPVARPPRSPMRRANSVSASSSAGTRPSSPMVSSPLSRRPSNAGSSPHDSPQASPMKHSISLPSRPMSMTLPRPMDFTIQEDFPSVGNSGRPAFVLQEATPPSEIPTPRSKSLDAATSEAAAPSTTPQPAVVPPVPTRPSLSRRSTTSSTIRTQDPDFHDPNLPDREHESDAPIFSLPSFPTFKGVSELARSLPSSPKIATAALSSWLPSTSPVVNTRSSPSPSDIPGPGIVSTSPAQSILGGTAELVSPPESFTTSPDPSIRHSSPISIPSRQAIQPEEESPWADVLSSARPALTRMSSVSSIASERFSFGLGKAKEVLAGFAPALDDDDEPIPEKASTRRQGSPSSQRSGSQRMSTYETAAFGVRMG